MKCLLITKSISSFYFLATVCILKIPRESKGHFAISEIYLAGRNNKDILILCFFCIGNNIDIVKECVWILCSTTVNDVLYRSFCLGITIVNNKAFACICHFL